MRKSSRLLIGSFIGVSTFAWAQNPVDTLGSITANNGMYSNRIPVFSRAIPYTEVCIKDGQELFDLHPTGGSTEEGDNCFPGDTGWVIEQQQRAGSTWTRARVECLKLGMRLPEPFEWRYSCDNAQAFELADMTGDWEWASNSTIPVIFDGQGERVSVAIFGFSQCTSGAEGPIAREDGTTLSLQYRCVK